MVDGWVDYWRVFNIVVTVIGFVTLTARYLMQTKAWPALVTALVGVCLVWCATGFVSSLEGIFLHAPLGVRVPLVTAGGILSTLIGMKESWWHDIEKLRRAP